MRSPRLAALLGALLALATAAPAMANTLTVDPADANNACTRGSDETCKTITQAIAAAQGGDTISVLKGTYPESPTLPSGKNGLIVKGAGLADTKIIGSGTGDVVTIAGDGQQLSDLGIEVPAGAQSALAVTGANATVTNVFANRTQGGNEPAVDVTGGPLNLVKSFVVQKAGTGSVGASSSGPGGIKLTDAVIASFQGAAMEITDSAANQLVRSTVVSAAAGANGINVTSGASSPSTKALRVDSSIVAAPADGIKAVSLNPPVIGSSTAGPINLDIRHSTVSAKNGLVLDSSAAQGMLQLGLPPTYTSPGNITATVASSIVHGGSIVQRNPSPTGGNTASLTFTASDAPPPSGSGTYNQPTSNTPDAQLFAPGKLTLRADAPVIDKGGDVPAEDSQTDINGDPRVAGPRTDMGADEFVNQAPKAALAVTKKDPRENEIIGFGSASVDPEGSSGGSIKEFRWDFGDGQTETTTRNFTGHAYTKVGTYKATLTVVDNFGAVSAPSAPVTVTVGDGVPPVIAILQPTGGAKLVLNRTVRTKTGKLKKRKPLPLSALGTATDSAGIQLVQVAITRVVGRTCFQFTGRVFKQRDCKKLTLIGAALKGNQWAFTSRRGVKFKPGRYQLRVRAVDKNGVAAESFTKASHSRVDFRIK